MKFLICLLLVTLFTFAGSKFIKKHANLLYVAAALLSAYLVIGTFAGLDPIIPHALKPFIWEPLSRGSLGSAFFVLVMFAGAVKTGSQIQKTLMPIRAEMSIIASILTLGHNIAIGKIYFVMMVTEPGTMPLYQLLASICSVIMLVIMLPLFVTSFPAVRKQMNARSWKKLQRLAYGFYALMYIHSMLLFLPKARHGNTAYLLNVAVFTVIFMVYGAMRIMKAMDRKKVNAKAKYVPVLAAVALSACVAVVAAPRNLPNVDDMIADGSVSSMEASGSMDTSADVSADASQPEQLPDGAQPAEPQSEEEKKEPEQKPEQKQEEEKKPTKGPEQKPEQKPAKEPEKKPEQKPAPKPAEPAKPAPEPEKPAPKPAEPAKPAPEPEKPAPKPEPPAPKPEPEPEPPKPTTKYKDGTFTGSAQGYNGPVTVKVTIQNDKITAVSVVSHTEDEPFWSEAKGVIGKIVSSNSTGVDSITGATTSSDAIKSAVKNAMSKAKN